VKRSDTPAPPADIVIFSLHIAGASSPPSASSPIIVSVRYAQTAIVETEIT
jgi:hypothetical protein